MRLVNYRALAGRPSVGVVDPAGGGVHDLGRLIGPLGGLSPMRRLLVATAGDPAAATADTPLPAWSEIVLQPPVPDPSKIVTAPVNYRDPQAEMQQSSAISSVMVLHPGDLIAIGTPAGMGQVVDGDELMVEIGRVGTLRASVDARAAVPCPTCGANAGPVPPAELTPVQAQ